MGTSAFFFGDFSVLPNFLFFKYFVVVRLIGGDIG